MGEPEMAAIAGAIARVLEKPGDWRMPWCAEVGRPAAAPLHPAVSPVRADHALPLLR
jgi:hypothetical protein